MLWWAALGLGLGQDVDHFALVFGRGEGDFARNQCEQRVVFADTDVLAGVEAGSALTNDDVTGDHDFSAKLFHAEALAVGLAAVLGTTRPFLMCHGILMLGD